MRLDFENGVTLEALEPTRRGKQPSCNNHPRGWYTDARCIEAVGHPGEHHGYLQLKDARGRDFVVDCWWPL